MGLVPTLGAACRFWALVGLSTVKRIATYITLQLHYLTLKLYCAWLLGATGHRTWYSSRCRCLCQAPSRSEESTYPALPYDTIRVLAFQRKYYICRLSITKICNICRLSSRSHYVQTLYSYQQAVDALISRVWGCLFLSALWQFSDTGQWNVS